VLDLKVAMWKRELTGRRMAKLLGISESYLSEIIHGRRKAPAIRQRLVEEFGFPKCAVEIRRRRDRPRQKATQAA
jgi:plasmid maintenance system antidote protein VapI